MIFTVAPPAGVMLALCLTIWPAQGLCAHLPSKPAMFRADAQSNREIRPMEHVEIEPMSCSATGRCRPHKGPTARTVCRETGLCIPASPAWLTTGPLANRPSHAGGFSPASSVTPTPVPLPSPLLPFASVLIIFGTFVRALGRRHSN